MSNETTHEYLVGDCLEILKTLPDKSVDLVFCSPPYEDARLYGELNYKVKGQDWVDWCLPRYLECLRVCKGLVAWVVEGKTRKFQWSATPALLMADLHRKGVKLRKPPVYHRVGIPGSGGPDWLRNDYEFCVCASHGKLPWSDNTACGHPPKYGPGGPPSHRRIDGSRINEQTTTRKKRVRIEPQVAQAEAGTIELPAGSRLVCLPQPDGTMRQKLYRPPAKANPGNVFRQGASGGGNIGHELAHENEAPFSEGLAEFFIRSFCPPTGVVLDCFGGSGTTSCVSRLWSRNSISIDIRESQKLIWEQRIADPRYIPKEPLP